MLRNILAIAIGILVGALFCELATRLVLDDGMNFDLEMWKYAKEIKVQSSDPEIGHEHSPNSQGKFMGVSISTNSLGLRNREISNSKDPSVTRILMLGDSLTLGWGVRAKGTTSEILENILNHNGADQKYEVINTGVGNYNTSMEVAYFVKKGYKLKPDIVILNYFINDAEPTPRYQNNWLMRHLYSMVYIAGKVDIVRRTYFGGNDWKSYYEGLYDTNRPSWTRTKLAIHNLAVYCRKNNIDLILVNYPELHQLDPYPFAEITKKVEMVATENKIPFVDLLPTIANEDPQSLWVSPTEAHPNEKANEVFAKEISSYLKTHQPVD